MISEHAAFLKERAEAGLDSESVKAVATTLLDTNTAVVLAASELAKPQTSNETQQNDTGVPLDIGPEDQLNRVSKTQH